MGNILGKKDLRERLNIRVDCEEAQMSHIFEWPQSLRDNLQAETLEACAAILKKYSFKKANKFGETIKHSVEVADTVYGITGLPYLSLAALFHHYDLSSEAGLRREAAEVGGPDLLRVLDGYNAWRTLRSRIPLQVTRELFELLFVLFDIDVLVLIIANRLSNFRHLCMRDAELTEQAALAFSMRSLRLYAPLCYLLGLTRIGMEIDYLCYQRMAEQDRNARQDSGLWKSELPASLSKIIGAGVSIFDAAVVPSVVLGVDPLHRQGRFLEIGVENPTNSESIKTTSLRSLSSSSCNDLGGSAWLVRGYTEEGDIVSVLSYSQLDLPALYKRVLNASSESEVVLAENLALLRRRFASMRVNGGIATTDTTRGIAAPVTSAAESPYVYFLTRSGEVRRLPKRATVLDAAFAVHTDLGLRFRYGLVNDAEAPPDQEIQMGDVVQISTDESIPRTWSRFVRTKKASSEIARWAHSNMQEQRSAGVRLLMKRLAALEVEPRFPENELIRRLSDRLGVGLDELLCGIGRGFWSADVIGDEYIWECIGELAQKPTYFEIHTGRVDFSFYEALIPPEAAPRPKQAPTFEGRAKENKRTFSFGRLVTQDQAFAEVLTRAEEWAAKHFTVLISGETGCGKELLAKAIYAASPYCADFIPANCGQLAYELAASELFGHKKGAFTGADSDRKGKFIAAAGGTLFLDEIQNADAKMQAALLRALQNSDSIGKEIQRVGEDKPREVNTRVIVATNRDLASIVAQGAFREDLYYRLIVFQLGIPPLRERRGDIPLLVQSFLREGNHSHVSLADDAMARLMKLDWPGNVRSLFNVLRVTVNTCRSSVIRAADLVISGTQGEPVASKRSLPATRHETLNQYTREAAKQYGVTLEGRKKIAALNGVDEKTVRRWFADAGISTHNG